jgi:Rod binding domain-containing protein
MAEESIINSVPAYYNDSLNINSLEYNSKISDKAKLKEVGIQFESILVRQFLDEAFKNLFTGINGEKSPGSDVYKGMVIDNLADSITRTGQTGMAEMYSNQLQQMLPTKTNFKDELSKVNKVADAYDDADESMELDESPASAKPENLMQSVRQKINYDDL